MERRRRRRWRRRRRESSSGQFQEIFVSLLSLWSKNGPSPTSEGLEAEAIKSEGSVFRAIGGARKKTDTKFSFFLSLCTVRNAFCFIHCVCIHPITRCPTTSGSDLMVLHNEADVWPIRPRLTATSFTTSPPSSSSPKSDLLLPPV